MKPLNPGDLIALVSPGFCADLEVFDEGKKLLESLGFRVRYFGSSRPIYGRFNDTDEGRARHIESAFLDKEVSAILAVKGGYGTFRLTRHLDFALVRDNAKLFLGYSDVTALLALVSDYSGVPTFHAPMLVDLLKADVEENISSLTKVLSGQTTSYTLDEKKIISIQIGRATGKSFGGNITVLQSLIGACNFAKDESKIVFLEDVGEYLYSVERALIQLKISGLFDNAKAILFGSLILKDSTGPSSLGYDVLSMIGELFSDFRGPIVTNLPFGHGRRQLAIPHGVEVDIEGARDSFKMDFDKFWS